MAETQARPGLGVKIKIVEDAARTTLGEMVDVGWPGFTTEVIDATHMESPDGIREKMGGLVDHGQVTATLRVVPGTPGFTRLYEDKGKKLNFVIEFPDPITDECLFTAILSSFQPAASGLANLIEGSLTLDVSGPITWAEKA